MRHSGHLNLDRNRDLLFHLLRGAARPLRNDRHVVVGDIGIGFDRQVVERDRSPAGQQEGNGQHYKFVVQRKVYEGPNHSLSCLVCRCAGSTAPDGRCSGMSVMSRTREAGYALAIRY